MHLQMGQSQAARKLLDEVPVWFPKLKIPHFSRLQGEYFRLEAEYHQTIGNTRSYARFLQKGNHLKDSLLQATQEYADLASSFQGDLIQQGFEKDREIKQLKIDEQKRLQ